jgi:hypothetical protein
MAREVEEQHKALHCSSILFALAENRPGDKPGDGKSENHGDHEQKKDNHKIGLAAFSLFLCVSLIIDQHPNQCANANANKQQ